MKVLISAFVGSYNLGDEAIAKVLMHKFTAADVRISVLSINPPKTERLAADESVHVVAAGFKNFFKELRRNDALVLGGGGIIQDQSSVINMLYYFLQTLVASLLFRKPVYMAFVGVGPINSALSGWMLKLMSRYVVHAVVRDQQSASVLGSHGFDEKQITVAYDIVFNINDAIRVEQADEEYGTEARTMLFCPRYWFFVKPYLPVKFSLKRAINKPGSPLQQYRYATLQLVERTLEQHPDLVITGVPFFYTQDLDFLEWIKAELNPEHARRFRVEDEELLPEDFLRKASRAEAVLGIRLHSLILGAVARCSLVPVTYSAKVKSLTSYLGLESYTTELDKPEFDIESTLRRIATVMEERPRISEDKLDHIQTTNDRAFEQLVALMERTDKQDRS